MTYEVIIEKTDPNLTLPFCSRKMQHASCEGSLLNCQFSEQQEGNFFLLTCDKCEAELRIGAASEAGEFEKTSHDGQTRTGTTQILPGAIFATDWQVSV